MEGLHYNMLSTTFMDTFRKEPRCVKEEKDDGVVSTRRTREEVKNNAGKMLSYVGVERCVLSDRMGWDGVGWQRAETRQM